MRSLGLAALLATLLGAPSVGAGPGFPQAKIARVDMDHAPRVRLTVSLLDGRQRPVSLRRITLIEVLRATRGAKAEPLFQIVDEEPFRPPGDGEDDPVLIKGDDAPTLTLAAEDDPAMAVMVVMPGYGDAAYARGTLGERMRNGAGLFFKKLGKGSPMGLVWVSDDVWMWVRAQGRTRRLSRLTPHMVARCAATRLDAIAHPPDEDEDEEGDDGPASPDEEAADCGLAEAYEDVPRIIQEAPMEGTYPHLFGLGAPLVGKPAHQRTRPGRLHVDGPDEDVAAGPLGPPALDVALRTLIDHIKPGQPGAIVLLGDGRDGYIYPADEAGEWIRSDCAQRNAQGAARRRCITQATERVVIEAQERFRDRLAGWVGLAKGAGIRIFSVVHPLARPHEAERLEALAWRTGGTARRARDAHEMVDLYHDLMDELNGELVIRFEDPLAVDGASLRYQVRLTAGGRTLTTEAYETRVPVGPTGPGVWLAATRARAEASLGPKGTLAVLIVLGLIVAFLGFKIFKKILGRVLKRS